MISAMKNSKSGKEIRECSAAGGRVTVFKTLVFFEKVTFEQRFERGKRASHRPWGHLGEKMYQLEKMIGAKSPWYQPPRQPPVTPVFTPVCGPLPHRIGLTL